MHSTITGNTTHKALVRADQANRKSAGSVIRQLVSVITCASVFVGCATEEKQLQYYGNAKLEYYKDVAQTIDYPDVEQESPETVQFAKEPRRIRKPNKDEIWPLSLEEAMSTALKNAEFIRTSGDFLSPNNAILSRPDLAPSVYDLAIQGSGVLFGQRGVQAALADYDAQFTTSMRWGRNEQVSEQPNVGFPSGGDEIIDETARFRSQLLKQLPYGATLSFEHNIDYSQRNSIGANPRLFPSHYTNSSPDFPTLGLEYRHALWAAAGLEYNRIAGPPGSNLRGVSGVAQGVLIARINADISLADFEGNVRNMLKDVEDTYWDLYLFYRTWDAEVIARNSSLSVWRRVKVLRDKGLPRGTAAEESQARDNYFELRARAENALSNVYSGESRLRRLLGLSVNDGRIIRPADEPITAEFSADWRTSVTEALTNRVELRRQKWSIKSLQLQVKAAKSLTKPQVDFVSSYFWNGFGDRLFGDTSAAAGTDENRYENLYETLFRGDQSGWTMGFEFSMPIGFRAAHAQVRNLELRLAKARAALSQQELEISHELANSFQSLDRSYATSQSNFNRRRSAEERVNAYRIEYQAGTASVDLLLRSQISLAQAEIAYFNSLIEYNKAMNDLRYRKGTLLQDNNVHLSEGLWDPEAYMLALRRAWARSYAYDADDRLVTEPPAFTNCTHCNDAGCPDCQTAEPAGAAPVPPPEEPGASLNSLPSYNDELSPGTNQTIQGASFESAIIPQSSSKAIPALHEIYEQSDDRPPVTAEFESNQSTPLIDDAWFARPRFGK